MAFTIAVAGKGGVGKTSFCALLIRWLIQNKKTPVLAVDADPNSNLSEALGVEIDSGTIADIIASTKDNRVIPPNMSQDEFISFRLNSALTEADHFDLISMGGPDGPGCYCFPNNVLKKHLQKLIVNYKTIVMDNEAGLEHISRGTTSESIDALFILSDTSRRSIRSARRVYDLTKELKVPVKNIYFVITRSKDGDLEILADEIKALDLEVAGLIPNDQQLIDFEVAGKPLYDLPDNSLSVAATSEILNKTLGGIM